jgi:small subunit ribosomal protein S7
MSRRNRAEKRIISPDARYNDTLVQKLINLVMERGKKSVANTIVYDALVGVSEKLEKGDSVDVLKGALANFRPKLELKSRRVGGATYQVPTEISFERQEAVALRWLVEYCSSKKGVPMCEALIKEIVNAYNNTGDLVKKKEEVHKMALANRAYAHFRW